MLKNLTKQHILFLSEHLDESFNVAELDLENYKIFLDLIGFFVEIEIENWYKIVDKNLLIKELLILIIDTLLPDHD